jgi:predicted ATP-binding protein involved in virulence
MYLSRLILKNFRGFEDATLELDPHLTVLVGPNASGKSSLLRGLDLVASRLASMQLRQEAGVEPDSFDVRSGSTKASLTGEWNEPQASITVTVTRDESGNVECSANRSGAEQAPIWFYFSPTERSRMRADVSPVMGSHARASLELSGEHAAWSDDLNRSFLPYERFWNWFKVREDAENARRVKLRDLNLNDPALEFVRQSVERVLGGSVTALQVNRERPYSLLVRKSTQELAIEQLSDGERSLIILAASIARRLALFRDDSLGPVDRPATVLIDEVEQHLHGYWQRELLPRLRYAFPNVQFVVTTHSPVVLSSIESGHIRVLSDFRIYSFPDATYGRDANSLFEDVFGVPRRPDLFAKRLEDVGRLLDDGNLAKAKEELAELSTTLGEEDADIVRLRVLADFLSDESDKSQTAVDADV